MPLDIGSLKRDERVRASVPFHGGSTLVIQYLDRRDIERLRDRARETVYERHLPVERVNKDRFYRTVCQEAVKGWEDIVVDGEALSFNPGNIDFMFERYTGFDQFVYEVATEFLVVEAFRKAEAKKKSVTGSGPGKTTKA